MSTSAPGLRRMTPTASWLPVVAAGAWIGVVVLAAHVLASLADRVVGDHATAATALASATFAACGIYQLTPVKDPCLAHRGWGLMAVLVAFGPMNVWAMIVLTAVVVFVPGLAPGLHHATRSGSGMGTARM